MAADIAPIARALNGVTSAGQTQVVIGQALNALGRAYPLLSRLNAELARNYKASLDAARVDLENWYHEIKGVSPAAEFKASFSAKRRLVERAYIEIAGVEAASGYKPSTSNLDILVQSIKEAPKVFAQAAGSVVASVGEVAGSAVGGVVSGLGISGTLTLVVVGLVVLVVLNPSMLGRLFGKVLG